MPISHGHKFIYIHIPKCAGTSVTEAFKRSGIELEWEGPTRPEHKEKFGIDQAWLHHLPATTLRHIATEKVWKKYWKFSFVRNPWDLVVSYYYFNRKLSVELADFRRRRPKWADTFDRSSSFEEWVPIGLYLVPSSTTYLMDEEGKLLVDFVGRFENLGRDFQTVCQRIGIKAGLPHAKKTDHLPYRRCYNESTKEAVRRHLSRDIEFFGYDF